MEWMFFRVASKNNFHKKTKKIDDDNVEDI